MTRTRYDLARASEMKKMVIVNLRMLDVRTRQRIALDVLEQTRGGSRICAEEMVM